MQSSTYLVSLLGCLLEVTKKDCRGRGTSKLILQGHNHPDTKTRQRQHKKRMLQVNITDEHRIKNPHQNFSKQNSAILRCTESVMPSNQLILCCPLLLPPLTFPRIGYFQMSQLSASGGQSIGVSASTSVLPMSTQD